MHRFPFVLQGNLHASLARWLALRHSDLANVQKTSHGELANSQANEDPTKDDDPWTLDRQIEEWHL